MEASILIRRIEAAGGRFLVRGRSVEPADVPPEFQEELGRQAFLVKAWILERKAALDWEKSGHDPNWWRE